LKQTDVRPTDEQLAAIDQAKRGESFKVMAYAGSGKTTTLQLISEQLRQQKGLYLAFNKAIADEARSKFAQRRRLPYFSLIGLSACGSANHRQTAPAASIAVALGGGLPP
jgi:superfamily II DNA or RNA helicase